MTVAVRGNELFQKLEIFQVIKDQEPPIMTLQPALDSSETLSLINVVLRRDAQLASQRENI